MKSIEELTDRELREWIYRTQLNNQAYLRKIAWAATFFSAITIAGIVVGIIIAMLMVDI